MGLSLLDVTDFVSRIGIFHLNILNFFQNSWLFLGLAVLRREASVSRWIHQKAHNTLNMDSIENESMAAKDK